MVFNHSFFDPLKDYSGREQYLAVTKDDLSPAKTRSKIGCRRVRKKGFERVFIFVGRRFEIVNICFEI